VTRAGAAIGSIVFFVFVPGVVAGAMPFWITGWQLPEPLPLWGIPAVLGGLLLLPALWVLVDSFVRFARNLGTPAPVAPTQRLVVDGWYRFVRNPMYVAVLAIIFAQALLFWSWPVALYGCCVFVLVHLFVVFNEEPALRRQFPADYAAYAANVRRWLPRVTPWRANQGSQ